MFRTFIIGIGVVLTAAGMALAGRLETIKQKFPASEVKSIVVKGDFSVGHFTIEPADMAEAASVDVEYDSEYLDCDATYEERAGKGFLDLTSESRRNHNHNGDTDNDWNVVLSTRYQTEFQMDIGASDMEIDLGGIPVTDFDLDIGAADGRLEFSKPNPARLREMTIEVGASSFDCVTLGNANFESLRFESGAASGELDLRGAYTGESEVSIEVGAGSLDIILPKNLPVHIEADDNWFSSVDFHHDDLRKVHKGVWESRNYEDAKDRIFIQIEVGMGSVDVFWKE